MKYLLNFLILLCSVQALAQDNTPIGTWRMHLPYNSVRQIVEADKFLYVLAERGIYTFDLKSGEVEFLTKVEGFAESEVAAMAYSEEYNTLVIAYENTNIDLLKGNRIINLPGIERSNIVGQKNIHEVKISDSLAYIATSFGIVVIDFKKEEIIDDYQNLGFGGAQIGINSIVEYQDSLYIGTTEGIKYAPAHNDLVNLKNFESWQTLSNHDSAYHLTTFNGNLYFANDSTLYSYTGGSFQTEEDLGYDYRSLVVNYNQLIICRDKGILIKDANNNLTNGGEPYMSYAIKDFQDNLWFGGFYLGLIKKTPQGSHSYVTPQGPFGPTSFEMKGKGTKMWVTSGGHTTAFAPTYNGYGYYQYQDGRWENRSVSDPKVGDMLDFTAIEIDPNEDEVWLASFYDGLVQMKDGKVHERYDETNSALQLAPGNLPVVFGLALDRDGDLWMSNYETDNALVVRRKNGDWKDFNVGVKRLGEMIVDENDFLWTSIPRSSNQGIMVTNELENGAIQKRILTSGKQSGGLPNNNVRALALDKDGEIWVGTETGLAVFYNPSLVFSGGLNADAQQIIIDDGSDIGYLLGNEVINDIKIDGANRKWIATNNGAWLVKEDGSQVIEHITTKNSPLPCNQVICVGIVPKTGEVFFGTNCGIASFRGDATEASNLHENTLVFPNPVHPNYEGPITISGVPEDATVKIVDVAGRVVYELIATGGTAVWDGRNFNGDKPQTGVYLIFSANKDDEDALVSKLLIVR
jgi:ligand-binding sensor domain-containing protein